MIVTEDRAPAPIPTEVHPPLRPVSKRLRKFVVVVDGTPESERALQFAAQRAAHVTGGGLVLFHCIRPGEFQHWMAVADRMREEAQEEASELLHGLCAHIRQTWGVTPERVITEGDPKSELPAFMRGRDDLFALVLAASDSRNPGPLIDYFTHEAMEEIMCPVIIIPAHMTGERIDDIA